MGAEETLVRLSVGVKDPRPEGWQDAARVKAEERTLKNAAAIDDMIDRLTSRKPSRSVDGSAIPAGKIPRLEAQERALLIEIEIAVDKDRKKKMEEALAETQAALDAAEALLARCHEARAKVRPEPKAESKPEGVQAPGGSP